VFENANVLLTGGPFWDCLVIHDDNTPVVGSCLTFDTLTSHDDGSKGKTLDVTITDESGRFRIKRPAGVETTVTAQTGPAEGVKVSFIHNAGEPALPAQIILPRQFTTLRKVLARVCLEDGSPHKGTHGFADGQKEPMLLARNGDTGWWRLQFERAFEPKEDVRFRAAGGGLGICEFTMQAVPPGMVLELDAIVLPGPRTSRVVVVNSEGKPLAAVRVSGRVEDLFAGATGQRPTIAPVMTDEYGIADIEILPGREYRLLVTRTEGGSFQATDLRFTHAGPYEIRWKSE
jgi:hypothetical protein